MRELTWKEKIIDSQYDNAISKWGESLEILLEYLPKIEHLCFITLQRGKEFKVNIVSGQQKDVLKPSKMRCKIKASKF